jgi:threonine 3-dehydrogenase
MAMPDAVRALLMLLDAPAAALTRPSYNIGAISLSAQEIAGGCGRLPRGATSATSPWRPRPHRRLVARRRERRRRARADWGWRPLYDADRAFDEYLVPAVRARYGVLHPSPEAGEGTGKGATPRDFLGMGCRLWR